MIADPDSAPARFAVGSPAAGQAAPQVDHDQPGRPAEVAALRALVSAVEGATS
jgi:hypothetical protein